MRPVARTIHAVLAWLLVAALVVQVWLAGRGVFESPGLFATHRDVGYTLILFPIVLLVLGFLGGMGRRVAIMAAVVFGLMNPAVGLRRDAHVDAGHCRSASRERFLILLVAILLARESWAMRTAPA